MLLRHLTENQKVAIFAFGRMNPPTIGHKKLVDKITSIPGDHFLFLSHTVKPKTDPLSHKEKVYFAQKSFGTDITIGSPDVRTIIDAMKKLEALGYTKVIYVAGSDRIKSFDELLKKYNGTEYNFDVIEIANAGERDPDAEGAEGMSASKLKAAASQNDFDTFKQGVAGDEKLAQEMFDAVKQGMGIKNEILGFATRNVPRATIKKKPEKFEPSVADKLKARRAAAAKGDKDAYTHKFNKKDEDLAEWFISMVSENFADGKVKGKSRPGRVKKSGASCNGSVSSLRAKASKYGGEKGKMYHWCANMKGGKK